MTVNFDEDVNRRGTNSVKWEFMQDEDALLRLANTERSFGENRILPMWVADMDFRCPEPVVRALVERAKHGIYGYSAPTQAFFQATVDWMHRRHGWQVNPEWMCNTPGVISALNMAVRTFTAVGDGVLIQPPVYYPFSMAIENNGRRIVVNPLIYEDGRYRMDFEDLETKIVQQGVRMAILCSPHNPVGRVWTKDELLRFGEICLQHDVLVVSDEIHGDLIYSEATFTPFATVAEEFMQACVICTSPSKSFNLAGLHISTIIIPNRELYMQYVEALRNIGLFGLSTFGVVALQAAYELGEPWLAQAMRYIEDNNNYLQAFILKHLPQIRVIKPEGTYLVWLDCRALGLEAKELKRLMLDQARVYLDEGFIFGPEGAGFERINIACPRALLVEALARIKAAVDGLEQV
jgi:cystathionine beta-lyase